MLKNWNLRRDSIWSIITSISFIDIFARYMMCRWCIIAMSRLREYFYLNSYFYKYRLRPKRIGTQSDIFSSHLFEERISWDQLVRAIQPHPIQSRKHVEPKQRFVSSLKYYNEDSTFHIFLYYASILSLLLI